MEDISNFRNGNGKNRNRDIETEVVEFGMLNNEFGREPVVFHLGEQVPEVLLSLLVEYLMVWTFKH